MMQQRCWDTYIYTDRYDCDFDRRYVRYNHHYITLRCRVHVLPHILDSRSTLLLPRLLCCSAIKAAPSFRDTEAERARDDNYI